MAAKTADPAKKYNSNPFTLSFNALNRLFKTNLVWAIVLVVLGFIGYIPNSGSSGFDGTVKHTADKSIDPAAIATILAIVVPIIILVLIISVILQVLISGALAYVMIQSEQGKSVSLSEAFRATLKRFRRLFWATILANLKIFAWTLLFIIPGIIAALRFSLLPYLIMDESDKKRGIVDSHDKTKAIVKGRLWEVFGINTAAAIVPVIGLSMGLSGYGALYRQLQYSHQQKTKRPKIHWLNYLGIWLLVLTVLIIIPIIMLIAAVLSAGK